MGIIGKSKKLFAFATEVVTVAKKHNQFCYCYALALPSKSKMYSDNENIEHIVKTLWENPTDAKRIVFENTYIECLKCYYALPEQVDEAFNQTDSLIGVTPNDAAVLEMSRLGIIQKFFNDYAVKAVHFITVSRAKNKASLGVGILNKYHNNVILLTERNDELAKKILKQKFLTEAMTIQESIEAIPNMAVELVEE